MRIFHADHGPYQLILNIKRQAGRDAVRVNLVRRQALGFQKNLVTFLVGEAVDFVFDARAIARTHAVNLAGEHGAAVKAAANDVVRARVGVGDVARHLLRVCDASAHETEHRYVTRNAPWHAVTGLRGALAEVNRAPVDAWRRPGFQSALWQLQLFEPRAE